MKIGFIGYGRMGSVMIKSLLTFGALKPNEIIISTRSPEKVAALTKMHPAIHIAQNNCEAAHNSQMIFLCVKPRDVHGVMEEIYPFITANSHLIIITGCVKISNLEAIYDGKVSKVMPTLISETGEGVMLICHGRKVVKEDKERIAGWFSKIGKVKELREDQFEMGANLTSCAPAFLAAICEHYIHSVIAHSNFGEEEAADLLLCTLYGTAKLLTTGTISLMELQQHVATKGGISEQGLKVLAGKLPAVFDELFEITLARHAEIRSIIDSQFLTNRCN